MTVEEKLPIEKYRSKLKLADGLEIDIVILDDGTRVFPAEDFQKILNWMGITIEDMNFILKTGRLT